MNCDTVQETGGLRSWLQTLPYQVINSSSMIHHLSFRNGIEAFGEPKRELPFDEDKVATVGHVCAVSAWWWRTTSRFSVLRLNSFRK
jgi:hypothetical protein